jgi:DNA-binding NarL/FixJ family response regulator
MALYKRKIGVLIVDDDKQVLKSLRIWLKNEGFRPFTAATGDEALLALKENIIEVALVDYRLTKENGVEVANRLTKTDALIKVIILTGFPSYETAVRSMKAGIFDYISKGSSNDRILEVIRKAVDERERDGVILEQVILGKNVLRLVLFCNHSLLQERLENFSHGKPGFKLLKTFASMSSIKTAGFSQQVDIALICAGCTIKSTDDAYHLFPVLYRSFPDVKPVIINENFSDEEKVELLKLGVRGFSSRDLSSDKLEKALLRVKRGEIWVPRNVINLSLQNIANQGSTRLLRRHNSFGLTDRELDILRTMVLGLKNREIAEKLFISERTVKSHVNRIFKKLGASSRAHAILTAVEGKIV